MSGVSPAEMQYSMRELGAGPVRIATTDAEWDGDWRGLLWYRPVAPDPKATYVLGCDPTYGITGWNRQLRTDADTRIDNAAIEVLKLNREGPDEQVAEYAAPIDPEDFAGVINAMGRIWAGSTEDGQALVNLEVFPGPGIATLPELRTRYGYTNIYIQPYLNALKIGQHSAHNLGWVSDQKSKQLLWSKCTRYLQLGGCCPNSPALVEELASIGAEKFLARSRPGQVRHDDRITALFLAIWAGRDWTYDMEEAEQYGKLQPKPERIIEYQAMDCSAEEARAMAEEQFERMFGGW
jgi:hypothetical protein